MYLHRFICTNTLPKQLLMASHPSYSMYMACNEYNSNWVYLTRDKIKFLNNIKVNHRERSQ